MNRYGRRLSLALAALALILAACTPSPVGPTPGSPVTETVTPAGGSVSATVAVAFEFEDKFGQRTGGDSLSLNVTCGGCSSVRGGAPALQVGAAGP